MHMPKLPLVSNSRIFFLSFTKSQTFILPSYVVLARYCPSSLSAIAQTSPALFSSTIAPSSSHCPDSATVHILTSPPNPALAAWRPLREVAMWWQPSLCAPLRAWARGVSEEVVEYTFMAEAPEAERIWVGVTAREKMSVGWAAGY
jgi:hypothetical protein